MDLWKHAALVALECCNFKVICLTKCFMNIICCLFPDIMASRLHGAFVVIQCKGQECVLLVISLYASKCTAVNWMTRKNIRKVQTTLLFNGKGKSAVKGFW